MDTEKVTRRGSLAANFTANVTSGAAPLLVAFTNTSTGNIYSYSWKFGDGATSTAKNPTHTYKTAGTYTVSLTVKNYSGVSNSKVSLGLITITGSVTPPVAAFTATPLSGAAPLAVQFTDGSQGVVSSWLWDFGDGTTSSIQNPSHTYANAGSYTIKLTVSGSTGSNTGARANYVTAGQPSNSSLILSEDFSGGSLAALKANGWYDGTDDIGWYFEKDATLGKTVIYTSFSNTDLVGTALRHAIPNNTAVTVWTQVKYHKLLATGDNCHHMYLGQGYGTTSAPAGTYTVYIEPKRTNAGEQDQNGVWQTFSRTFGYDYYDASDNERSYFNLNMQNIISDDQWYEIRYYIHQGPSNGYLRIDYKPLGGTWKTIINTAVPSSQFGSRSPFNQFLIGPYIHNGQTTDQRMYNSFVKIYAGDAITNGTIP